MKGEMKMNEHISENKEIKNEDDTRLCVCGSGVEWTQCPGNPELETPWMYCG